MSDEKPSLSSDVMLRRLRADDAANFKAIRLEALQASPELLGSTFEFDNELDVTWFAGRLEESHVLGAFRAGVLAGTAGFSVQHGPKNAHKGRVWGMYVQSRARRLGIGRLLVSALLDVARARLEIVQLTVVTTNQPARRLYDSLGFVEFGMEPKASKLGDHYYDEAHMMLDFGRKPDAF
ncbi:N-acetyltransferase family protein [Bradyrhizobium sp. HKCCYLS2038]